MASQSRHSADSFPGMHTGLRQDVLRRLGATSSTYALPSPRDGRGFGLQPADVLLVDPCRKPQHDAILATAAHGQQQLYRVVIGFAGVANLEPGTTLDPRDWCCGVATGHDGIAIIRSKEFECAGVVIGVLRNGELVDALLQPPIRHAD